MDFDFEINADTDTENNINIIEDDNMIEDDTNKLKDKDRYIRLLEILGLNVNVIYPIKYLFQIIIELHSIIINKVFITKINYSNNNMYKLKDDDISKKIGELLYIYNNFRICRLSRLVNRLYRHYKWNSWKTKDEDKYSNKIIGFNYMNPCWNSLETLIIS